MQVGAAHWPSFRLPHAVAWEGAAASVVDLHASLAPLGLFEESVASGIAENGEIVGLAADGTSVYAVLWSPIPEPDAGILAVAAASAVACIRRSGS